MTLMGPLYQSAANDGTVIIGLRLGMPHTNMHSIAHGGMLSTLADNALGYNVSRAAQSPVVTMHLSIDFLDAVRPGDWIEAHVTINKRGKRIIYAACQLLVGDLCVLKANGIFSLRKSASQPESSDG
ncbi:PaaI family thioesterase (plasmid) [Polaromonas sp. P1-6]|nr:PaaI family thioesterase [Polaromonas sp. P1-6]